MKGGPRALSLMLPISLAKCASIILFTVFASESPAVERGFVYSVCMKSHDPFRTFGVGDCVQSLKRKVATSPSHQFRRERRAVCVYVSLGRVSTIHGLLYMSHVRSD
jgi:hypothetical protein